MSEKEIIKKFVEFLKSKDYKGEVDKDGKKFNKLSNDFGIDSSFVFDNWKEIEKEMSGKGLKVVKENVMTTKDDYAKEERDNMGSVKEGMERDMVLDIVGGEDKLKEIINDPEKIADVYDDLYAYYGDDMPYGTAKARTGDPYEWVYQKLLGLSKDKLEEGTDISTNRKENPVAMKLEERMKNSTIIDEARSLLKDAPKPQDKPKDADDIEQAVKPQTDDDKPAEKLSKDEPVSDEEPEEKEEPKEEPKEKVNESAFSKQHYIAIANILKDFETKEEIAKELVDYFKKDNPRFDSEKFIDYIGI